MCWVSSLPFVGQRAQKLREKIAKKLDLETIIRSLADVLDLVQKLVTKFDNSLEVCAIDLIADICKSS